ncbi:MAG: type II toxin-antitoxin system HicB family antitoxin [Thermoanaerobaculia bacterium]
MTNVYRGIFVETDEGIVAFAPEIPGANTQGETLDEARANLAEAIQLVLETNRELAEQQWRVGNVIEELVSVAR